jgi:hypothetical protein
MNPEQPVRDIMQRTMMNLEFIEAQPRDPRTGPFEVTQLVNSFLGALAHPWERHRDRFNDLPLEAAYAEGWPRGFDHQTHPETPVRSLGDLLRHVRNALAHGNVTFRGPARGDIETIELWSYNTYKKREEWRGSYSVRDLRDFLVCFVREVELIPEPRSPSR